MLSFWEVVLLACIGYAFQVSAQRHRLAPGTIEVGHSPAAWRRTMLNSPSYPRSPHLAARQSDTLAALLFALGRSGISHRAWKPNKQARRISCIFADDRVCEDLLLRRRSLIHSISAMGISATGPRPAHAEAAYEEKYTVAGDGTVVLDLPDAEKRKLQEKIDAGKASEYEKQQMDDAEDGIAEVKRPDFVFDIVPNGTLAEIDERLEFVNAMIEETNGNELLGWPNEKRVQEKRREFLYNNSQYAKNLSFDLQNERIRGFLQQASINVPNMTAAVIFWTKAMKTQVLSTQLINGVNVTTVAYGSSSLDRDDGAKFMLNLVESDKPNDQFLYMEMGCRRFRVSEIKKYGGVLESAVGWIKAADPGGFPINIRFQDRRDPFAYLALRVSDMKKSIAFYESLGMVPGEKWGTKKLRKDLLKVNLNADYIFEKKGWTIPDRVKDSVLMTFRNPRLERSDERLFSDERWSTGLCLVPADQLPDEDSMVSGGSQPIIILSGSSDAGKVVRSPDGVELRYTQYIPGGVESQAGIESQAGTIDT